MILVFFEFDLPTPANTTRANPVRKDMKLATGIIHFVEIRFPPGCKGLVHLQVRQVEHPTWPKDQTESIKDDNHAIRFNEFLKLDPGLTTLTALTWNTDVRHPHTPIIRIGLLQPGELFPEVSLADLIRMFFKQFRRR